MCDHAVSVSPQAPRETIALSKKASLIFECRRRIFQFLALALNKRLSARDGCVACAFYNFCGFLLFVIRFYSLLVSILITLVTLHSFLGHRPLSLKIPNVEFDLGVKFSMYLYMLTKCSS